MYTPHELATSWIRNRRCVKLQLTKPKTPELQLKTSELEPKISELEPRWDIHLCVLQLQIVFTCIHINKCTCVCTYTCNSNYIHEYVVAFMSAWKKKPRMVWRQGTLTWPFTSWACGRRYSVKPYPENSRSCSKRLGLPWTLFASSWTLVREQIFKRIWWLTTCSSWCSGMCSHTCSWTCSRTNVREHCSSQP